MIVTIQFRRGTAELWEQVNPTLNAGEPAYETDTGRFKIGNGINDYVSLPYQESGGGDYDEEILELQSAMAATR